MKGLKEFFRMIITAVVCFGAKLFGGNKKGFVRVCTENGNAFFLTGGDGIWNHFGSEGKDLISKNRNLELKSRNIPKIKEMGVFYPYSRYRLSLKEVMPWKQGPGDSNRNLHKTRSPSGTVDLKETLPGWFYLVPE